jgi:hypothetical protein
MTFLCATTDLFLRHTWTHLRDEREYWVSGMRAAGLVPPASSEARAALRTIVASIAITNNGKLMLCRIPPHARSFVPELIDAGLLLRAGFLEASDAVRMPEVRGRSSVERRPAPASVWLGSAWVDSPDYEGAILARQEAWGYYD